MHLQKHLIKLPFKMDMAYIHDMECYVQGNNNRHTGKDSFFEDGANIFFGSDYQLWFDREFRDTIQMWVGDSFQSIRKCEDNWFEVFHEPVKDGTEKFVQVFIKSWENLINQGHTRQTYLPNYRKTCHADGRDYYIFSSMILKKLYVKEKYYFSEHMCVCVCFFFFIN